MVQLRSRQAFTLPEMLIVTGIIGLLLAMALPAIMHVRAASETTHCKNNVRNVALALTLYHTDYGTLPSPRPRGLNDPAGIVTWRVLISPYLEESKYHNEMIEHCKLSNNPLNNPPHTGLAKVIRIYQCPSDSRLRSAIDVNGYSIAFTSYLGVSGNGFHNGVLFSPPGINVSFRQVTDGLSNTLMVGERPPPDSLHTGYLYPKNTDPISEAMCFNTASFAGFAPGIAVFSQYGPGTTSNPSDMFHFWSLHPRGAVFAFCDSSVRLLPYSSRETVYKMATRNGREIVEDVE